VLLRLLPLLIDVERIEQIAMLVEHFQLKSPAVNGDAAEVMIDVNDGQASDAQFGQYIVVQFDGDYSPFLPTFLFMNNTIHMTT
jgi:hypothetical protein